MWDGSGRIVCNYHSVARLLRDKTGEQVTRVGLYLPGGEMREFQARAVGSAAAYDLAVLQIDAPAELLVPVELTSSVGVRVGQSAYALGATLADGPTFSAGVISGLNRTIPSPTGAAARCQTIWTAGIALSKAVLPRACCLQANGLRARYKRTPV